MDEGPISDESSPKSIVPGVQVFPPSILFVNSFIPVSTGSVVLSEPRAQTTFSSAIDILYSPLAGVVNPVAFSVQNWAFALNEITDKIESKIFFMTSYCFKFSLTKIKKNIHR